MIGRVFVVGAWLGFAVSLACGPTHQTARCMPSNCNGCCDDSGVCRDGNTLDACGALGASCDSCELSQACVDGSCRAGGLPSDDAGVDPDGGTDGGNTGSCNGSSCNGCCRNGQCLGGDEQSACGAGGEICVSCMGNQACDNGSCTGVCNGCTDVVGACHPGTSEQACGTGGNSCVTCFDGQLCVAGQCENTTCSASNCDGCCDGDTCLPGDGLAACGAGGAACQACTGNSTCEGGTCVGSSTGTDGGFGFDGGFPPLCANCTTGCCDLLSGTCKPGNQLYECGSGGSICAPCDIFSGKQCINNTCQ